MKNDSVKQPNIHLPTPDLHLPVRRKKRRTKLSDVLGSTSMRIYGAFFLTFGAFTVFSQLFKYLIDAETTEANILYPLICGFVLVILSIPLFVSDKPLWKIAVDVPLFRFISFDYFCLPHTSLHTAKGIPLLLSMAFGFLFSAFGFFVSPLISVMTLLGLMILFCAVSAPEMPLFLSILLFPFFPLFPYGTHGLSVLILICLFAYLRKLLGGRRKADLSFYDVGLLLFGVLILLGGIFSDSASALTSSLLLFCLILVCPLVGNLLTNPRLLSCAFGSFVVGSYAASILTVLRSVLGNMPDLVLRNTVVMQAADYLKNATDTQSYSVYLLCAIFASLYFMREKTSGFFFGCNITAMLFSVTALAFSLDFFALFAAAAAMLTVRIYASPKRATSLFLFPVVLAVPALLILPHYVPFVGTLLKNTALDFDVGALAGTVGILRRYALFGCGVGNEAVDSVLAGLPDGIRSDSLFFPLLVATGVTAFAVLFLILLIRPFHLHRYNKRYGFKTRNFAAFCGSAAVFAVAVLGVFRYPFFDLCDFYPFFTAFALGSTAISNHERDVENRMEVSRLQSEANEATANVLIRKH